MLVVEELKFASGPSGIFGVTFWINGQNLVALVSCNCAINVHEMWLTWNISICLISRRQDTCGSIDFYIYLID